MQHFSPKASAKDNYLKQAKKKLLNMTRYIDPKKRDTVLKLLAEDYDKQLVKVRTTSETPRVLNASFGQNS